MSMPVPAMRCRAVLALVTLLFLAACSTDPGASTEIDIVNGSAGSGAITVSVTAGGITKMATLIPGQGTITALDFNLAAGSRVSFHAVKGTQVSDISCNVAGDAVANDSKVPTAIVLLADTSLPFRVECQSGWQ